MEVVRNAQLILGLLAVLGTIFGGGVTAYFIIKSQLVHVLQDELKAYKDKVLRLEGDIMILREQIKTEIEKNFSLSQERDYLRNILLEALTTKTTVNKNLLTDAARIINSETDMKGINEKS